MTRPSPAALRPPSALTLAVALALSASGCAAGRPPLDLGAGPRPAPEVTLVWSGRGEAERLEGGAWRRTPEFDYEFSVVQRRYPDRWESVKTLRRLHPAYDGSAGPREQVMSFRVAYGAAAGGQVASTIASTLGDGTGRTDPEFRHAVLELDAGTGSFAPFDTFRITQDYRYEQGRLEETVELLRRGPGAEQPWVRNHEVATLYGARAFDAPPTRFAAGR